MPDFLKDLEELGVTETAQTDDLDEYINQNYTVIDESPKSEIKPPESFVPDFKKPQVKTPYMGFDYPVRPEIAQTPPTQDDAKKYTEFAQGAEERLKSFTPKIDIPQPKVEAKPIEQTFQEVQESRELDNQIEDLLTQIKEQKKATPPPSLGIKTMGGGIGISSPDQETGRKLTNLRTAEELLNRLKKYKNNPQGFWQGVKQSDWSDVFTAGLKGLADSGNLLMVAKKAENNEPLTEDEQNILTAYAMYNAYQSENPSGFGYSTGQLLTGMIPFMTQIALTGGAGSVITKGGKEGAKFAIKEYLKTLPKNLVKQAAYDALRVPLMPMVYKTLTEKLTPDVVLNKQGQGTVVEGTGRNFINAAAQAFAGTFGERYFEGFGGIFDNLAGAGLKQIGKLGKNILFDTAGKNTFLQTLNTIRKSIGLNNPLGELIEEDLNGLYAPLIDDEIKFSDTFNLQTQGQILLSSAIMGGMFKIAETPGHVQDYTNITKPYKEAIVSLSQNFGEDAQKIIQANSFDSLEERMTANDQLNSLADTPEKRLAWLDYFNKKVQYDILNESIKTDQEEKITEQVSPMVNKQTGMIHPAMTLDEKQVFITSTEEGIHSVFNPETGQVELIAEKDISTENAFDPINTEQFISQNINQAAQGSDLDLVPVGTPVVIEGKAYSVDSVNGDIVSLFPEDINESPIEVPVSQILSQVTQELQPEQQASEIIPQAETQEQTPIPQTWVIGKKTFNIIPQEDGSTLIPFENGKDDTKTIQGEIDESRYDVIPVTESVPIPNAPEFAKSKTQNIIKGVRIVPKINQVSPQASEIIGSSEPVAELTNIPENAETIRSDTGYAPEERITERGSQDTGGENIQLNQETRAETGDEQRQGVNKVSSSVSSLVSNDQEQASVKKPVPLKKKQPIGVSKDILPLLQLEPQSFEQGLLQYLLSGGRIDRQQFIRYSGLKGKDLNPFFSMLKNNGQQIDTINEVVETFKKFDNDSGMDMINEVVEIMTSNPGKKAMGERLQKLFGQNVNLQEFNSISDAEESANEVYEKTDEIPDLAFSMPVNDDFFDALASGDYEINDDELGNFDNYLISLTNEQPISDTGRSEEKAPVVQEQPDTGTTGVQQEISSAEVQPEITGLPEQQMTDRQKESQILYELKEKYETAQNNYKKEQDKFAKENKIIPTNVLAGYKFRQTELGLALQKEVNNAYRELYDVVDNSKFTYSIPYYNVTLETDTNTEQLYDGYDLDDAKLAADNAENSQKYNTASALIQTRNDEFVFADATGESPENYPVDDDYYRENKYIKTSKENEFEIIDSLYLEPSEKSAEDLDYEVRQWMEKEYGRNYAGSYESINLGEDKDGRDITLQIRIKNHSENPANKGSYSLADHYLSIVIANKDETAQRFHSSTELYFTGDNTLDDVKEQVSSYIQDIIDNSDIVKLNPRIKDAGHTVFTPVLSQSQQAELDKQLSEIDSKIQEKDSQLNSLRQKRERELARINSRNGLFGDTQQRPNTLFAGEFLFNKETVGNALKDIDGDISNTEKELDSLNKLRTGIVENAGKQQELKLEQVKNDIAIEELKVNTEPTPGQKEAGNYQKGHINIQGLDITIENPKGSTRKGVDDKGNPWESVLNNTYGYFKGTEGKDKDHVDVFLGDNPLSEKVYVVDQIKPETEVFDEHKIMMGFETEEEARNSYLSNYQPGWTGLGAITEMSINEFKEWVFSGNVEKPLGYNKSNDSPLNKEVDKILNRINEKGYNLISIKDTTAGKIIEYKFKDDNTTRYITVFNNGESITGKAGEEIKIEFNPKPEDINYKLAYDAYRGTSFEPEKRAKQVQQSYVEDMNSFKDELYKIAQSEKQKKVADEQLIKYKEGYIKHENAWLSAKSRTLSTMIAGPSNFNVRRAEKANSTEHKRSVEFTEWQSKSRSNAIKAVKEAATPEQKENEAWSRIKTTIDDKLETIIEIDKGLNKYTSRQLIVSNLNGFIKRMYNNGQYDHVIKAMDHIQDVQSKLEKPILLKNNSLWQLKDDSQNKIIEKANASPENISSELYYEEGKHSKTGAVLHIAKIKNKVSKEEYNNLAEKAKENGGYYSSFVKGFIFKTKDDADFFISNNENINKPDIRFSLSSEPFYSNAEYALNKIQQPKGTPEQFKAMLLKNGAKQDELDWMGWDEFVKDKKSLTKDEIQNWIDENKVEVKEVVKKSIINENYTSNEFTPEAQQKYDQLINYERRFNKIEDLYNELYQFEISPEVQDRKRNEVEEKERILKEESGFDNIYDVYDAKNNMQFDYENYQNITKDEGNTKYSQYTIPGGKNYKEVLLALPVVKRSMPFNEYLKLYRERFPKSDSTDEDVKGYYNRGINVPDSGKLTTKSEGFMSSHFEEPNIAVHLRINEFTTKDGKRALNIEEVQSDWAQKGKKEGFSQPRWTPKEEVRIRELEQPRSYSNPLTAEEQKEYTELLNKKEKGGLPDMPFKKTDQWVGLGMKWALRYAAENGFDVVTWTTGETQADRYDLSKSINEVTAYGNKGIYELHIQPKQGQMIGYDNIPENKLEDYIGKELAKKVIEHQNSEEGKKNPAYFSGLDLKVGGEGMKSFYDQIIPSWVNKYTKKWNAKTSTTEIITTPEIQSGINTETGELSEAKTIPVHSIEITPEMKESVLGGQPMFKSEEMDKSMFINSPERKAEVEAIVKEIQMKVKGSGPTFVAQNLEDMKDLLNEYGQTGGAMKIENQEREAAKRGAKIGVKGLLTPKAVFLCSEFLTDENDVLKTWIHEQVGHYGNKLLFPEKEDRNKFLRAIYNFAGEQKIYDTIGHVYKDSNLTPEELADEYQAKLAEKLVNKEDLTPDEQGVWQKIKTWINDLIARIFGKELTWNSQEEFDSFMEDVIKAQTKLVINEERTFTGTRYNRETGEPTKGRLPRFAGDIFNEPEIKLSTFEIPGEPPQPPEKPKTISDYLPEDKTPFKPVIETNFEKFQEAIQDRMLSIKKLQKELKVTNSTDVYKTENLSSSRANNAIENFNNNLFYPIIKTIGEIEKMHNISSAQTQEYMKSKHAIERNAWFRTQTGIEKVFAGISDKEAQKIIAGFESKVTKTLLADLWFRINKATEFTLNKYVEYGFMTRQNKDDIKSRGWEYYVPLRGWELSEEEQKLDEEYNLPVGFGSLNPLKTAKGRESLSDDPLPYIASMAHSIVAMGEKNRVKQAAVKLVMSNKEKTNLFNMKKVYRVQSGVDEEGKPTYIETYEVPQATDDAKQLLYKDHQYKKERSKWKQHEVEAYINGDKYVAVFADPNVAHAINYENQYAPEITRAFQQSIGRATRWLSQNFTAKNPAFIPVNGIRDIAYASIATNLKYGTNPVKFLRYIKEAKGAISRDFKKKTNLTDRQKQLDKWYQEFKEWGGQTGYVHLTDIPQLKKEIERQIRRINHEGNWYQKGYDYVNQAYLLRKGGELLEKFAIISENMSRFATYVVVREQGKSPIDAAFAAKEVTVNFNKKGRMTGILGSTFAFFNASVQGGFNALNLAKEHKGKFIGVAASFYTMGVLNSLLSSLWDDDDKYKNINDYIKQTNLVIPKGIGEDSYISIPLPQFFRQFFAAGVLTMQMFGKEKEVSQGVSEMVSNAFESISPVNPASFINKKGETGILDLTRPFVPTIGVPVLDIIMNEDFAGKRIVKTPFTKELEESSAFSQQYGEGINPILTNISDVIYRAQGGDKELGLKAYYQYDEDQHKVVLKRINSVVDAFNNPAVTEHIIEYYTGGRGKFFSDLVKLTGEVIEGSTQAIKGDEFKEIIKDFNANSVPILNRLNRTLYNDPSYELLRQFYQSGEKPKDYQRLKEGYKKLETKEGYEKFGELSSDSQYQKLQKLYDERKKIVGKLNSQIKDATERGENNTVDELKSYRDQLIKDYLKTIGQ